MMGVPPISWHTARDGWADVVFWLALVATTLGKIATEIATLMRTEVNEVREPYQPGRGTLCVDWPDPQIVPFCFDEFTRSLGKKAL